MPPPDGLEEFLAKVPAIEIAEDKVEHISVTTYEKLQHELGTSLRKFEESESHRERMKKRARDKDRGRTGAQGRPHAGDARPRGRGEKRTGAAERAHPGAAAPVRSRPSLGQATVGG
eukprot:gb/GFBE01003157.1/.p1 GENE.gb/GFBE01003157.1/~~gb/GFBE01003157.1/.p1  ORF type:complete len:117 (+),score=19.31 gb/GFBE01003157.1/:1-351(+)